MSLWGKPSIISRLFGCIVGLFAVLYFLTWLNAVDFGRTLGVMVLAALFISLVACFIATLLRWPQWALAMLIWVVFAFGNSFEFKHEAKYLPLPVFETQGAFALWIFDRPDADFYRKNKLPYPVFLISSEGGGGYAKAHAYTFLSKMTERCTNFAQHVSALVGVSGGQLGNTLYHSHLNLTAKNDVTKCTGSDKQKNANYLSTDHLSPLIAQLLFVETPRNFYCLERLKRDAARSLPTVLMIALTGINPFPIFLIASTFGIMQMTNLSQLN